MKKRYIYKVLLGLITTLFMISCDDYLDEAPDDRLELDTLEKASKVMAQAYSQASYVFTDMYTDYAGATGNLTDAQGVSLNTGGNTILPEHTQLYSWDTVLEIEEDTPNFYWNNAYQAIAHANEVLIIIDQLQGDDELRNAIRGEALLTRAYHHFMLVNLFGLHYNDQASNNLGVPYVTAPETEFLPEYQRSTVEEVYDLVEQDFLEGLSLVNDKFYTGTKKYHFTVKAAQAFASRFYLWKGDYENCKKYSDLFLGGNPQNFVKDYTLVDGSGYEETAENYSTPEDDSNVLVMQQFSAYTRRGRGFGLNASGYQRLYRNLFGITDIRTSIGGWSQGTDATFTARLREYFFREDLTSNSGQPYYIAVELKGEEVLFNRAEAELYLGNTQAALDDINVLAATRYGGNVFDDVGILQLYYQQPNDEAAIIALLLDERKKEFWDHGLRWFDIKRYNIPISHQFPINLGGELIELEAQDLRKAIQIPANALAQGLIPNPR